MKLGLYNIDPVEQMANAFRVAQRSPDPSTQVGAVLLAFDGEIQGTGFNGFTTGMQATPERLERPLKYTFVEHAERAAIHSMIYRSEALGVPVRPDVMVCTWGPCAECARAIVEANIAMFFRHKPTMDRHIDRWADSIAAADEILTAGGVQIIDVDWNFADLSLGIRHLEERWVP